MPFSYATQRKIRIIEERIGSEWKSKYPGSSIDSVFNQIMGDDRKNLFCKIESITKDRLDEMTIFYKTGMAEFIEQLIMAEWQRYDSRRTDGEKRLLAEFSGVDTRQ